MEDLWAFNEEVVARAIFDCDTPVISAVGHETDTTIADYVADLRAPTPSAAAELAVFDYSLFCNQLETAKQMLERQMEQRVAEVRQELRQKELELKLQHPQSRLNTEKQYLSELELRLHRVMEQRMTNVKHRQALLIERLEGLSPLKKLTGGYGYISRGKGAVTSVNDVTEGEEIQIRLQDGRITAVVRERSPQETMAEIE